MNISFQKNNILFKGVKNVESAGSVALKNSPLNIENENKSDVFVKSSNQVSFKGNSMTFKELGDILHSKLSNYKSCLKYYEEENNDIVQDTKDKFNSIFKLPNFDLSYLDETKKVIVSDVPWALKESFLCDAMEKIQEQIYFLLDRNNVVAKHRESAGILTKALDDIVRNVEISEKLFQNTVVDAVAMKKKFVDDNHYEYDKYRTVNFFLEDMNVARGDVDKLLDQGVELGDFAKKCFNNYVDNCHKMADTMINKLKEFQGIIMSRFNANDTLN